MSYTHTSLETPFSEVPLWTETQPQTAKVSLNATYDVHRPPATDLQPGPRNQSKMVAPIWQRGYMLWFKINCKRGGGGLKQFWLQSRKRSPRGPQSPASWLAQPPLKMRLCPEWVRAGEWGSHWLAPRASAAEAPGADEGRGMSE